MTRVLVYSVAAVVVIKLIEFGRAVPLFGFVLVLAAGSYASVHLGRWIGVSPEFTMVLALGVGVAIVCGLALYGYWKGMK